MNTTKPEQVAMIIPYLKAEYETKCFHEIMRALNLTDGNKQAAADILGIKRTTLTQWLIRHAPQAINYKFTKKKNRKTGGNKKWAKT